MTINNGGPAYPTNAIRDSGFSGMSLRDWFAGMAMQGMYAATKRNFSNGRMEYPNERACAGWSFAQADAMLAAREQQEPDDGKG